MSDRGRRAAHRDARAEDGREELLESRESRRRRVDVDVRGISVDVMDVVPGVVDFRERPDGRQVFRGHS